MYFVYATVNVINHPSSEITNYYKHLLWTLSRHYNIKCLKLIVKVSNI